MTDKKIEIEQIHADTVLVIVRGEYTRFASLAEAHHFRGHLEEMSAQVGKPIVFFDHSLSIEQLNDDQLAVVGLQRIQD